MAIYVITTSYIWSGMVIKRRQKPKQITNWGGENIHGEVALVTQINRASIFSYNSFEEFHAHKHYLLN